MKDSQAFCCHSQGIENIQLRNCTLAAENWTTENLTKSQSRRSLHSEEEEAYERHSVASLIGRLHAL